MPMLLLFALCLGLSPYLVPDSVQTRLLQPELYAGLIDRKELDSHIRFLSDSTLQGRETGTAGGSAATSYIAGKFLEYGLLPLGTGNPQRDNTSFIQGFACPAGQRGRNVIGWVPARTRSDEYIVVSAHYDHLGTINGIHYPGADSNASGVSALLSLVRIFSTLEKEGYRAGRNIIFVAYDAKEFSMTGARIFALSLGIPANQIVLNMNLDMLGTSLEPPDSVLDYVLILGAGAVPPHIVRSLNNSNFFFNLGLDLDYSFYNSPGFADIYFTMTEQSILAQMGVPSLLISSGLNDHTYKPSDTPEIINLPVLEKRVRWLFFSLWDLAYR
ncbi:MAG: M28 family peptidase [Bacteroidales bacterium]|nr:M28 family peptidase [Bacteroidales bacterium]NLH23044.1 M28 family peptidase [Bacteroidales bacterium]HPJ82540.1 M28 family peptidase [Bacteroidales bacterium]